MLTWWVILWFSSAGYVTPDPMATLQQYDNSFVVFNSSTELRDHFWKYGGDVDFSTPTYARWRIFYGQEYNLTFINGKPKFSVKPGGQTVWILAWLKDTNYNTQGSVRDSVLASTNTYTLATSTTNAATYVDNRLHALGSGFYKIYRTQEYVSYSDANIWIKPRIK